MSDQTSQFSSQLLGLARTGTPEALDRLFDMYRSYMMLLARMQIDRRFPGKVDASDLVQDTLLNAYRRFGEFRGTTEAEFLAWVRRILCSRLVDLVRRYYLAECRDVRLERRLEEEMQRSSGLVAALIASGSTPTQHAIHREDAVVLADALHQLPHQMREVIILHDLQELTFGTVAERLGMSEGHAQRLWVRALSSLRQLLGSTADDAS